MSRHTPEDLKMMTPSEKSRASGDIMRGIRYLIDRECTQTRADLAERIGVDVNTLNEWLRGKVPPLCRQGHFVAAFTEPTLRARVASRLLAGGGVEVTSAEAPLGSSVTQCALDLGAAAGQVQGALSNALDEQSAGGSAITESEAMEIEDAIAVTEAALRSLRATLGDRSLRVVG